MLETKQIVGVDGCKGGWVAVYAPLNNFENATAVVVREILDLRKVVTHDAQIIIDIPIGLEWKKSSRLCDKLGRKYLGNRRSTLFSPPCLQALTESSYEQATRRNKEITGVSFSKQSWFLKDKILEVRNAISNGMSLSEGHPECSFTAYNGRVFEERKKSLRGMFERLSCLMEIGFNPTKLVRSMSDAKGVKVDDLLDASILCWTAGRVAQNEYFSFPSKRSNSYAKLDCKIFV